MQPAELTIDRKVWVCDSTDFEVVEVVVISRDHAADRFWLKREGHPAQRYFASDCRPTRDLALLDALESTRNAMRFWAGKEEEAHKTKTLAGRRHLEVQDELCRLGIEGPTELLGTPAPEF